MRENDDYRNSKPDAQGRKYHDAILSPKQYKLLMFLLRGNCHKKVASMLLCHETTIDKLASNRGCTRPARDRVAKVLDDMDTSTPLNI